MTTERLFDPALLIVPRVTEMTPVEAQRHISLLKETLERSQRAYEVVCAQRDAAKAELERGATEEELQALHEELDELKEMLVAHEKERQQLRTQLKSRPAKKVPEYTTEDQERTKKIVDHESNRLSHKYDVRSGRCRKCDRPKHLLPFAACGQPLVVAVDSTENARLRDGLEKLRAWMKIKGNGSERYKEADAFHFCAQRVGEFLKDGSLPEI